MKDSFEYEGNWWLPENPEVSIFGRLTFTPGDKLNLKVEGLLNPKPNNEKITHADFINPTLVQGVLKDESGIAKDVTIYKCQQFQSSSSLIGSGLHSSSFFSTAAFVGVHFNNVDEVKFKSISIHFSNAETWSNKYPISMSRGENTGEELIQYIPPETVWAEIDRTLIRIAFLGPNTSYSYSHVSISYETRVEITPAEEKSFEEYLELIRRVQNFLSLSMGGPVFPLKIIGSAKANQELVDQSTLYPPVNIYYLTPWWPSTIKEIHFFEMLFPLPAIADDFQKYLKNWLEKYQLLTPVINLYFSVLYNPNSFAEVKFLSLAQAIETYHRRVADGKYQEDEQYAELYDKLISVIPSSLSDDFKASLKSKLRYGNEYSLRTRLRKVVESATNILDFEFIKITQKRTKFISKVVSTRNYWTHYSPELKDEAVQTGEERLIITTQLQLLLELCFLKELGFEPITISELIKKSSRYRLLKEKGL
jgi:hypothetical protein